MDSKNEQGAYKKVSALVDNWLELHRGETFDLDTICRQLQISERENRNLVTIKLAYEVKTDNLEKYNKIYRYIDNSISVIDWVNADEKDILANIKFPYGLDDDSHFGFEETLIVSPGDIHIIAGQSNVGKTAYCQNFLWNNMDTYPCTLMGNEYTAAKFKRRVSRMKWNSPFKENGTPKFELIERYDNWHDIIRPDNINIIDWITVGDNFYLIGRVIEKIKSKLNKGIALIALQKAANKTLGEGGDFSKRLSSLYLVMDFELLTVDKAKEWNGHNPNHEMYGFTIVEGGTQFHNIRPVKKCPKCWGKNPKCELCSGKGYIDIKE